MQSFFHTSFFLAASKMLSKYLFFHERSRSLPHRLLSITVFLSAWSCQTKCDLLSCPGRSATRSELLLRFLQSNSCLDCHKPFAMSSQWILKKVWIKVPCFYLLWLKTNTYFHFMSYDIHVSDKKKSTLIIRCSADKWEKMLNPNVCSWYSTEILNAFAHIFLSN